MSDSLQSLIRELQDTRNKLYAEAAMLDGAVKVLERIHAERDLRLQRNDELRMRIEEWVRRPPTKP